MGTVVTVTMKEFLLVVLLSFQSVFGTPFRVEGFARTITQMRQRALSRLAENTQWFPASGTDCVSQAATATPQQGWPGYQGQGDLQPGTNVAICFRRRRLFRGGRYSSWRYVDGLVQTSWMPDFMGVLNPGGGSTSDGDVEIVVDDVEDAVDDAVDGVEDFA